MLLVRKSQTLLLMATLSAALFSEAKPVPLSVPEVGTYILASGDVDLCGKIVTITKSDLTEKYFSIGDYYSYVTQTSKRQMKSDIDKDCEFKESNSREDLSGTRIVLTRINQELCKGKLRSIITSTATLTPGEIEIRHEIDSAEPYTCRWQKKK